MKKLTLSLILSTSFLTGCASSSLSLQDETVTAEAVITEQATQTQTSEQQATEQQEVLLGGTIVSVQNTDTNTIIEVIAQPLHLGQPVASERSIGRFIAVNEGFLDPEEYSVGKSITVAGIITGVAQRRIGQTDYDYPLIKVSAKRLWPNLETGIQRVNHSKNHFIGIPAYKFHKGFGFSNRGFRGGFTGSFGFGHKFGFGFSKGRSFGRSNFGHRGRSFNRRGFGHRRSFNRGFNRGFRRRH